MICSLNITDQEWRIFIWFLIDFDDSEKFPVIGSILFCFTVFQTVFLTLSLFLSIPYVIVVGKCRKFHMNLTRIIVFTKIHLIFMIGTSLLGLLYVFRFIKKTGDCVADFPLVLLGYTRFITTCINFGFFPAILLERTFSIRHMWDYEKKRRIYIANTINANTTTIAIVSGIFLTVGVPQLWQLTD
ncbi:unnamed protein product, partial [Mesorhabditis belari]|uniref:Uncharacterized protein n=1 Tax=Mesorhabditis belari TaxID=2138241 RepID=A0AAF3J898_9BILA